MTNQASADDIYAVIRLIRPLHILLAKAVTEELRGTDITMPQRAVLEALLDGGAQTMPQIARRLMLPRQFIRKLCGELPPGLIVQKVNPAHRRSRLIALTPAGTRTIAQIRQNEARVIDEVMLGVNPQSVAQCRSVLTTLLDGFQARQQSIDGFE